MATPRQRLFALTAVCAVTAATAAVNTADAAPSGNDRVRSTNALSVASPQVDRALGKVGNDRARYGLSADQKLIKKAALTDSNGTTHVRAQQTYKGLPVVGGDLVVHEASGGAVSLSRSLVKPLKLGTKATAAAPKMKGAQGSSKLVVEATASAPRLAWETTVLGAQSDGTPSRKLVYTDANTGQQIRSEERVMTVGGQGNSLYGGTVPLQLTQSGSAYQLKDPTRGNTYTVDIKNQTDSLQCQRYGTGCPTGTLFSSTDTIFGTGTTSSRESAAVDAQYGTDSTWDYFKGKFNRSGIFGTGAGSYNRVHYGQNYVNAFWDGEKMTYGDGDGVNYGPLTSLDVAAHEMSHGVTENSANLVYSGEPGGLNEATSDIFGAMVEFNAANTKDKGDYIIGEAFDKTGKGLRRMDNPASDGRSLSCWSSSAGSVDVHYSSGIGNHFYYLLAEGSGAKTINGIAHNSPTCDSSTVTGIGRDAAQQIWYRALTVYMTSNTNYAAARTATLNSAKDLYGATSTQYAAVNKAWSAVNVK